MHSFYPLSYWGKYPTGVRGCETPGFNLKAAQ
jgi:hypothetical protein